MNYLELVAAHGLKPGQTVPLTYRSGRRNASHYVIDSLFELDFAGDENHVDAFSIVVKPLPADISPKDKGTLGEHIGKLLLAFESGEMGVFTNPDAIYDMDLLDEDIEFKFSPLHEIKPGYYGWTFYLDHGKKDSKTGKYSKVHKDYSKSCTTLVLIGLNPDGGLTVFFVPSHIPELRNRDNIKIPFTFWQGKSMWSQYHYEPYYMVGPPNREILSISDLIARHQTNENKVILLA